ncbi:hypothetical protein FRC07_002465 [Ceratobasidium sp. 392]|nr:hypothetical protein FRC07_002465 [Ceratobasidium sp. 392]
MPVLANAVPDAENPQEPRRRTFRNAARLATRLVAKVVIAPGLQDSTQTVRSLIDDLKAPKANDAAIREVLAQAEEIYREIANVGEATSQLDLVDMDSPATHFQLQLQELSDFLQSWEKKFKTLQRKSYLAKLANQDETSQQLVEYNRKLNNHLGRLDLKSVALAGFIAINTSPPLNLD